MKTKLLIAFPLFIFLVSCKSQTASINKKITSDTISNVVSKDKISVEGKFIKIEKEDSSRYYDLYLKINDSIVVFKTVFIIGENEIPHLKKEGNNIRLIYYEHYNPVTRKIDKLEKAMAFIYE